MMASVTLTYKGQVILELDRLGTKTLKTGGKYCEADIELAFIQHCPRSEQTASYLMDAFFAAFDPATYAKEVTE